jgi:hypothetical protein
MFKDQYRKNSKPSALLIASLLVGCANTGANYRPIIDSKNVDFNKYEADLLDCQNYARKSYGAGEGAVAGAAAGAAQGETDQRAIIRRCLNGRGYSVLK